jgi:hypothetical protein
MLRRNYDETVNGSGGGVAGKFLRCGIFVLAESDKIGLSGARLLLGENHVAAPLSVCAVYSGVKRPGFG